MGTIARCLFVLLLACGVVADATAQVHVRGYYRKNGTYVAPHVRSSPNSSKSDNYSARGNYNPYTGKTGTQNPYPAPLYGRPVVPAAPLVYHAPPLPLPARSNWRNYGQASSAASVAPSSYSPRQAIGVAPRVQVLSLYQCEDAQGVRHYLAYPRAGCVEIRVAQQQARAQPQQLASYGGRCTYDCSGHEAGYEWAENNGIDDPDNCGGNSQSFIEGCEAYAEEQQVQMVEDGDCDDEDEDDLCD